MYVPMDLQVCNANLILTTANPVRVQIMVRAQIWWQITPVPVQKVSSAITVKTVLTTAKDLTAAKMASALTLLTIFTATVALATSGITAN